ncbi:hypothetical protein Prudu_016921 [Prunus dulcis]|uniref:Uncharacterized protein n=1 Tax=Prunus dulcis TaxID=3755 RepID=A0A4Y1RMK0_PRUDU|nr:hypothetical protein Prudu_016921 [Prunus dulcis]
MYRSPGYSELANPRSRILIKLYSSEPPAQPTSAATAPALMDHLAVGPVGSQAPASSSSSVAQPVSTRRRHRPASTPTPHLLMRRGHSQPRRTPRTVSQLKTAKVRVTNSHELQLGGPGRRVVAYVNRLFSERYKQWKSDLHHYFEALMIRKSLFRRVARRSLRGGRINKAKVNKGNRKKKTLLHHSGSRPFSYRMDARRQRGPKFPEIDIFGDVYVRPGNELAESFIRRWWRGASWFSGVRLPTSSRYSNRVCGSSTGCWVSDLDGDIGSDSREETGDILSRDGNARRREPRPRSSAQSNSQVTALTAQVATLQSQMSVILQSSHSPAFQSRILMCRPPSPSIPSIHQTTAPVDPQTFETACARRQCRFWNII